ncbi:hypothetical protein [Streptomyces sp. NPDC127092]|uniref:hypothetical protein n=1 Tax=Streptomyces sp. NPDC127092 TaxID=3347135 RepID=UPI003659D27D
MTTVLRGGAAITPQGIGDVLRAMQPAGWYNPWASMAEYTIQDVPDLAQEVFLPDGGMSTLPDRPVLDTLLRLVDTADLDDLRDAWQASRATRDWALDLYARVEAEIEADLLDDAAYEWVMGRTLAPGMLLMTIDVSNRYWSPTDQASTSVGLLLVRQALRDLDDKVPGCQWELLESPAVMPPPLLTFFRASLARSE